MMSPPYLVTSILLCCFALSMTSAKPSPYGPKRKPCCVMFRRQPIKYEMIRKVMISDNRGPCRLKAFIFRTTDGDICANPADKWVKMTVAQLSLNNPALSKLLKKYNLLDKTIVNAIAINSTNNSNSTNTTLMDIQDQQSAFRVDK